MSKIFDCFGFEVDMSMVIDNVEFKIKRNGEITKFDAYYLEYAQNEKGEMIYRPAFI